MSKKSLFSDIKMSLPVKNCEEFVLTLFLTFKNKNKKNNNNFLWGTKSFYLRGNTENQVFMNSYCSYTVPYSYLPWKYKRGPIDWIFYHLKTDVLRRLRISISRISRLKRDIEHKFTGYTHRIP